MKNKFLRSEAQALVDVLWGAWQMLMFRSAKAHAWLPLHQGREEMAGSVAMLFLIVRWEVDIAHVFSAFVLNLIITLICFAFGARGRRFLISFMCSSIAVDAVMIFLNIAVPPELMTERVVQAARFLQFVVCVEAGRRGFDQIELDKQRMKSGM
ncbi:hypothetical protein [Nevskia ramosa]|uniref:hypothetical protein n=1 Tax=Nevskia ramosa TaxID=64002 RepID=UPI0023551B52|nr:hypothetical protein [Nevskia ramosa]